MTSSVFMTRTRPGMGGTNGTLWMTITVSGIERPRDQGEDTPNHGDDRSHLGQRRNVDHTIEGRALSFEPGLPVLLPFDQA